MKAVLGAALWVAIVFFCSSASRHLPERDLRSLRHLRAEIHRALFVAEPRWQVRFPGRTGLGRGSGVYLARTEAGHPELIRVGEVVELHEETGDTLATMVFDTARVVTFREGYQVVHRSVGASLLFSMQMLLPRHRVDQIREEWEKFERKHADDVWNHLAPVWQPLLKDVLRFLWEAVESSLKDQEPRLQQLVTRYREELVEKRVVPVLVHEVWPIITDKGADPMRVIGRELWDEVPLFSLAWRSMWDSAFSDGPGKLEAAFNEFVQMHAIPILLEHRETIQQTVVTVLREVADSPEVTATLREIAALIAADQELRTFASQLVIDVAQSQKIRDYIKASLKDGLVQARLLAANDLLQDFFTEVGNLMLLDETKKGINQDLAKLLRILVLHRDRQYIFVEPGDGEPLPEDRLLLGTYEL